MPVLQAETPGAKLDIQKFGTTYDTGQLSGSKFRLTLGEWTLDPVTNKKTFSKKYQSDGTTLVWTDEFDPITGVEYGTTNKLPAGDYVLEEVTAPPGYVLLNSNIYINVKYGQVKLIDDDGNDVTNTPDWWKLEGNKASVYILKVKNDVLYSLPSTGGLGIYWYMISGVLLMLAAAMIYIRNRRREVLNG